MTSATSRRLADAGVPGHQDHPVARRCRRRRRETVGLGATADEGGCLRHVLRAAHPGPPVKQAIAITRRRCATRGSAADRMVGGGNAAAAGCQACCLAPGRSPTPGQAVAAPTGPWCRNRYTVNPAAPATRVPPSSASTVTGTDDGSDGSDVLPAGCGAGCGSRIARSICSTFALVWADTPPAAPAVLHVLHLRLVLRGGWAGAGVLGRDTGEGRGGDEDGCAGQDGGGGYPPDGGVSGGVHDELPSGW